MTHTAWYTWAVQHSMTHFWATTWQVMEKLVLVPCYKYQWMLMKHNLKPSGDNKSNSLPTQIIKTREINVSVPSSYLSRVQSVKKRKVASKVFITPPPPVKRDMSFISPGRRTCTDIKIDKFKKSIWFKKKKQKNDKTVRIVFCILLIRNKDV